MKTIPPIQKYMTTTPLTIHRDSTLDEAFKEMKSHQIRHLPVMDGSEILGIISERDIMVAEALNNVDPSKVKAGDIAKTETYKVPPDMPTDEVVLEMAANKYGSALIVQNNKLVGIFTTVDALTAFAEVLENYRGK
ncbi:MAG: CBS domain-containing protein [Leptospiraceae bacterium]|nr:CBS domain-containing protein [Leptospiraceae bacterium]MCP5511715.1 CBS domain-containing protein [Leptospiraceae bacterium]